MNPWSFNKEMVGKYVKGPYNDVGIRMTVEKTVLIVKIIYLSSSRRGLFICPESSLMVE